MRARRRGPRAPSGHWTVLVAAPRRRRGLLQFWDRAVRHSGNAKVLAAKLPLQAAGATGAEQRQRDCLWTPCPASLQPPAPRQRIGSGRAARLVKRQTAGNAVRQPLQHCASGSGIRSALIIMPLCRCTKQQDLASLGAPRSSLVCAWPRSHREACTLLQLAPELLETSRLKAYLPTPRALHHRGALRRTEAVGSVPVSQADVSGIYGLCKPEHNCRIHLQLLVEASISTGRLKQQSYFNY